MNEIRVRFAPSPTGFLHVGGARTAIFNWLFARNQNGKFLLRIEDTDPERSKSELSEQIIRSMDWLGMAPDEPIVYQALNIKRHKEVAYDLLKTGNAYFAFETAEELDEQRKQAQKNKVNFKYNRASLKLDEDTINKYLSEGKPYAIRFKVPEGVTEFNDIVHGKTSFNNSDVDDFVILRSDGSPVYMIAVVVDDHDMNITHIIRGDDHLSNTPKQILLYKAMGWEVPEFAHLPMILDEEKKKLSKRRSPVGVEDYNYKGYLPEAMFNFLTLLGFSPPLSSQERGPGGEVAAPEKIEIVSKDDLIKMFTFTRVNKSSSVFDMKKLNWINSEYIRSTNIQNILKIAKESKYLEENGIDLAIFPDKYTASVIELMKERLNTINDLCDFAGYFFIEPENFDEKGLVKYWSPELKPVFEEFSEVLRRIDTWKAAEIEEKLRFYAENKQIKAAQLIHILRLSVTGRTVSPGIFEVIEVIGKDSTIRRIYNFLQKN
ncbi:MAG TPA: glutamate--tRNA ligase [Ignavibacteria bacterium]|nr:glutamate--tRNA ligase [Ignavibacteria bacterium]HRF64844.1 glutamate--tRNA ligase [Ignavibacteria bacterium]